jgi:hypothetical protein
MGQIKRRLGETTCSHSVSEGENPTFMGSMGYAIAPLILQIIILVYLKAGSYLD